LHILHLAHWLTAPPRPPPGHGATVLERKADLVTILAVAVSAREGRVEAYLDAVVSPELRTGPHLLVAVISDFSGEIHMAGIGRECKTSREIGVSAEPVNTAALELDVD